MASARTASLEWDMPTAKQNPNPAQRPRRVTYTIAMDASDPVQALFLAAHDAMGRGQRRVEWVKRQLLIATALTTSLDADALKRLLAQAGVQES